ncbi:28S ribosomal protein S31, mitochondrial-like isoform X2 [Mercenaria mercenaria]|uniref:28S ribosomal protein S31, mitochondrial-like isoform X2 n=1 Tax=Mercenaria mercenaria TaxID=6596 RepID=UPI00234EF51B|nr:28S ribosomal protein S31, mitochondrial-like isoform X2 [Mercenaria mercenaria]
MNRAYLKTTCMPKTMMIGRSLSCVFYRTLRIIEIKRRFSSEICLRIPAGAGYINTKHTFSTSPWLQQRSRGSEPGMGSGSSESGSDGEYSSNSSGSDSDSEKDIAKNSKKAEKPEAKSDLLTLLAKMKASEKKWGTKNVDNNLKEIEHSIDSKLVSEAVKLSKELPGDQERSESALIGQLLSQFETTAKQRKGAVPTEMPSKAKGLSAVIEGLSVEREIRKHRKGGKESYKMKEYAEGEDKPLVFRRGGSGLFNGKPLGIFTQEDVKYAHTGWEEESNVEFYEHVFLENQLHDFPKKGPIRHFMELVITALSKNPYLTVEQKHEHIDWYRSYFHGKQDMLEARLGRDGVIQAEA